MKPQFAYCDSCRVQMTATGWIETEQHHGDDSDTPDAWPRYGRKTRCGRMAEDYPHKLCEDCYAMMNEYKPQ